MAVPQFTGLSSLVSDAPTNQHSLVAASAIPGATALASYPVGETEPSLTSPPATTRRPSSREAILDAAEAVAAADGAAHLTLDAVAERAGVSKGGLLYNFPTKEALLEGMLERHMRFFEAQQLQALETLPPGPGRELKALVLSANNRCPQADQRSGCGTLAALANNPRLLEPVRAAHRRRIERLTATRPEAAALPFARTAVVSLAVDGLCLLEVLQISPYSADERQQIVDDLLRLVDETVLATTNFSNP